MKYMLVGAAIIVISTSNAQTSTQAVYSQITSPAAAVPASDLQVEIYGTSAMAFSNVPSNAVVYRLDSIRMLELELSAGLPADQAAAQKIVAQRMASMRGEFARRVQIGAMGQMRARGLGIDRVPAIVFGERQVVYGMTDVNQAKAALEAGRFVAAKGPPLPGGWDPRARRN